MDPTSKPDPTTLELTGAQRKHLRGLANPRKALVQVGDAGVSDAVIQALNTALDDHELVKVRLFRPKNKKEEAKGLAERAHAQLCGLVGHTVILYRRNQEKPKIEIPG